jgi:hypothetical protein
MDNSNRVSLVTTVLFGDQFHGLASGSGPSDPVTPPNPIRILNRNRNTDGSNVQRYRITNFAVIKKSQQDQIFIMNTVPTDLV